MCSHSSQAFKQGGRRGAKKVMIVITDGESHDSQDLQQAIEDSEKDGITRYAIAVSLLDVLFTGFKGLVLWVFWWIINFHCNIKTPLTLMRWPHAVQLKRVCQLSRAD